MIFWIIGAILVLTVIALGGFLVKNNRYKKSLLDQHKATMLNLKKENEWLDLENESNKGLNKAISELL